MEDKKILITGAGSGIGRALALWSANLNARLCLLSKSIENLNALTLNNAEQHKIYPVDFVNEKALEHALSDIIENQFIPDIIIHCAGGGFKIHNPFLSREEFQKLCDVNLSAIIQINSRLIPLLMAKKSGVVIHLGSIASTATHSSVGYNTVRAALAAYVRSLGKAMDDSGVVVTGLLLGSVIAQGNNMFHFQQNNPAEFKNYVDQLPTKRITTVEELYPIIKMLCTGPGFLFNGCMLPVDAGQGMTYTTH